MRWISRIPSEHQEQQKLIAWTEAMRHKFPGLSFIIAIPNGGLRPHRYHVSKKGKMSRFSAEGRKLKKEGVKPGVPDLFLPVPKGGWHGLFIELKRLDGKVSLEQRMWKGILNSQGYAVCICRGADQAITQIEGYLTQRNWSPPSLID